MYVVFDWNLSIFSRVWATDKGRYSINKIKSKVMFTKRNAKLITACLLWRNIRKKSLEILQQIYKSVLCHFSSFRFNHTYKFWTHFETLLCHRIGEKRTWSFEKKKIVCAVARLETCPMKTLEREYGFVTRFVKMFGSQLDTLLTCYTVNVT
jgi:hypothetical protein